MENIMQTLDENYIWVIVVAIFVLFTVIGFFVDRSQSKKRKNKEEKVKKNKKEDKVIETKEEVIKETPITTKEEPLQNTISERITLSDNKEEPKKEFVNDDTSEMSDTFLKEENYDLRNLMKESITESKEKTTSVKEEPKQNETEVMSTTKEEPIKDNYDRNLEYLLKEKEKPKEEIESIDDFLQRTMREAYQPTPEVEEKKESVNIEPTKENSEAESTSVDIDYEDTLPIPIQREDEFSPLEVTVVDPEFYKEYTAKPTVEKKESKIAEQKDIDFKPIEDAILESLGKLSENEEQKDI